MNTDHIEALAPQDPDIPKSLRSELAALPEEERQIVRQSLEASIAAGEDPYSDVPVGEVIDTITDVYTAKLAEIGRGHDARRKRIQEEGHRLTPEALSEDLQACDAETQQALTALSEERDAQLAKMEADATAAIEEHNASLWAVSDTAELAAARRWDEAMEGGTGSLKRMLAGIATSPSRETQLATLRRVRDFIERSKSGDDRAASKMMELGPAFMEFEKAVEGGKVKRARETLNAVLKARHSAAGIEMMARSRGGR